jgi:hypothetical protein
MTTIKLKNVDTFQELATNIKNSNENSNLRTLCI